MSEVHKHFKTIQSDWLCLLPALQGCARNDPSFSNHHFREISKGLQALIQEVAIQTDL